MINKTLLIASMLLFSQICNGQVEGRGIFCVEEEETDASMSNFGFIFEETALALYYFRKSGDKYEAVKDTERFLYSLSSETISWIMGTSNYTFYRKTGSLNRKLYDDSSTHYNCKVTDNESELEELMSELSDKLQEIYDKEREGNVL